MYDLSCDDVGKASSKLSWQGYFVVVWDMVDPKGLDARSMIDFLQVPGQNEEYKLPPSKKLIIGFLQVMYRRGKLIWTGEKR